MTTGLPLNGSVSRFPLSASAVNSSVRSARTMRTATLRLRLRHTESAARTSLGRRHPAEMPSNASRTGTVPIKPPLESVPPNIRQRPSSIPPVKQAAAKSAIRARGISRMPWISGIAATKQSNSLQSQKCSAGKTVNESSAYAAPNCEAATPKNGRSFRPLMAEARRSIRRFMSVLSSKNSSMDSSMPVTQSV